MDKEPYVKIDPISKLHIIYSLDNGQSKTDIARVYGVHPQTIVNIYRQKELIIKKHSQKYIQFKEVFCLDLDQALLEWLKIKLLNQNEVTEETLLGKAQEVHIQSSGKEFIYIEDWLINFRLRHNIEKFTPEVEYSVELLRELNEFRKLAKTEDFYIGGTCALAHSLSIDMISNGQEPVDYMSIFFIIHALGSNKRKITVVARDRIAGSDIGSLPVNFYCNNGLVNQQVIINHLKDWDTELASEEKTVTLALHMPENCHLSVIRFTNIRIININMTLISKTINKIVECFKYHYRKLQMTKGLERQHGYYFGQLDYINMISLAWFSIPDSHVKHIFLPPKDGSLYLRERDACDGKHSLLHWCLLYNLPLNLEVYRHCLNEFIHCDKDLKSMDFEDCAEPLEMNLNPKPAMGGMEAYQAMKRLLSYIQGEHASEQALKSARNIEDHLEYGALSEIHRIVANNATE